MPKTPVRKSAPKFALACAAAGALLGAFFVWTRVIEEKEKETACPATMQHSYFSTPNVFNESYARAKPRVSDSGIKGLIVPHHLLAAPLIAEAFQSIATEREVTVVLVSPNHFSAGDASFITTASAWRTPYGTLASDCDAVERLAQSGTFAIEESPFEKEHGVSGLVPFIKHSLPNARLVPIIVKDRASDEEIKQAFEALHDAFGTRFLVIGSFDFSHELSDVAARFHDRKSLAVIRSFDDAGAKALDIDSMPGLRFVLRLMDRAGARNFDLFAHANAAELTRQPGMSDVTSYLVGAFKRGKPAMDGTVTLLALGDMMLARNVEAVIRNKGPQALFAGMRRLYVGSDIVTTNAEGVFSDVSEAQKPVKPDDLRFPFEPYLLSIIKRAGFTHLGLANNHSLNFGRAALDASRDLMRQAGLQPFGDPGNASDLVSMTEVRGRKIAQIGYHQFSGHGPEDVLKAISEVKTQGAFVAVYPHWGVEYQPKPSKFQIDLAHRFIDAGADVVLGAHPHVIQTIEVYNGKAIFYSLGNFIFDQSFSKATSQGLAVGIANAPGETSFHLMPFVIRDAMPSLMSFAERATLLRNLSENSSVPDGLKQSIENGIFTLTP